MLSSSPGFVLSSAAVASACLLPVRKPAGSKRRLSCKATGDDGVRVDRRDVLLGLTGVGAAATTSSLGLALAADATAEGPCVTGAITADVLKCVSTEEFKCPAAPVDIIDFSKLPSLNRPMRVRKAAHLLTTQEVENFEYAIKEMRALPASDPRSFTWQSDIHEAYCNKNYRVVPKDADGGPETVFDVHFSSIFAPWHRMYIYFFEGILADLIKEKDPNFVFALPYWNWDAREGMAMPAIFAKKTSPLYDDLRNKLNVHKVMNFNQSEGDDCTDDEWIKNNNLCSIYRQMVEVVETPELFYGGKFCNTKKNSFNVNGGEAGSLENGPHNTAHRWLGVSDLKGANMGNLQTAARDPVFYSNHSNVDRMWHIYTTKLGGETIQDPKLLKASFVFYDAQHKRNVRITVSDVLHADKLGYTYAEKDKLEWMDKRPTKSAIQRSPGRKATKKVSTYPQTLMKEKPLYLTVNRPEKARAGSGGNKKAPEVLVVDVTADPCKDVNFYVLVNVPKGQEKKVGPQNCEFAGNCSHVRHGKSDAAGMQMESQTVTYRFPLRQQVEDLKCGEDKQLDITIVPCDGDNIGIVGVRVI